MSFPTQPEPTALRAAIYQLCEAGSDTNAACGVSTPTEAAGIWTALRDAIDSTVLPRELVLHVDGRAAIKLFAARRRLRAVQMIGEFTSASVETSGTADGFAKSIRMVCAAGRAFALTTAGRGPVGAGQRAGCSGQQLFDALTRVAPQTASDDPLHYLRSLGHACVLCDTTGTELDASGDADLLKALRRVAASRQETANMSKSAQVKRSEHRRPTCLVVPLRSGQSIVVAEWKNLRAGLMVSESDLSSSVFRDIFQTLPDVS